MAISEFIEQGNLSRRARHRGIVWKRERPRCLHGFLRFRCGEIWSFAAALPAGAEPWRIDALQLGGRKYGQGELRRRSLSGDGLGELARTRRREASGRLRDERGGASVWPCSVQPNR